MENIPIYISKIIKFLNNNSTLCTVINFIASIVTITSAIVSHKTKLDIKKIKQNIINIKDCDIAIDNLQKILSGLKKEIEINGNANKYIDSIKKEIETLESSCPSLKKQGKKRIEVIRNMKHINSENSEIIKNEIKSIIKLYNEARKHGL